MANNGEQTSANNFPANKLRRQNPWTLQRGLRLKDILDIWEAQSFELDRYSNTWVTRHDSGDSSKSLLMYEYCA